MRILERLAAWVVFKVTHKHEWWCTHQPDNTLTGGEKYYWHIHDCRYCDNRIGVLNHDCEGYYD